MAKADQLPLVLREGTGAHHWSAFDGLRAVAVLAVIGFHLYPRAFRGGYIGVDVFFVLSGFLITWLLVGEYDRFDAVSLSRFYARRALRLFPALAAVIFFTVLIVVSVPALATARHPTLAGLPFVLLYSGNWAMAAGTTATLGILAPTWSLAVEEQFYLIWPAALSRLLRRIDRRRLSVLLVLLAICEMVVRSILEASGTWWSILYYSSFTHSDGLLLGCAFALAWSAKPARTWAGWLGGKKGIPGFVGLGVLAVVAATGTSAGFRLTLWMTVAVIATLAVLINVVASPEGLVPKLLSAQVLQWIGRRSYGLYLWHAPIFILITTFHLPGVHQELEHAALAFVVTLVVAAGSYRFIERPFLRRKNRFTVVPVVSSSD